MQDPTDVIAQAVNGQAKKLATEMELSLSRTYEILSKDNPYPKTKRLIRFIARVNPAGARIIKADLDSMFADIASVSDYEPTLEELHKEAFEAVQAKIANKPLSVQRRELTELVSVAQMMLASLSKKSKKLRAIK